MARVGPGDEGDVVPGFVGVLTHDARPVVACCMCAKLRTEQVAVPEAER
jgi:hypothetical protein